MKWERTRKGWPSCLEPADSWLRLALDTINFGNGITNVPAEASQNAGKFTVFLIQLGYSKEWKEVKNAGFRRSIDDLDHNWYQLEFGDVGGIF